MYRPGTLILFEAVDEGEDEHLRFFLKCVESYPHQIKMEGGLPRLWRIKKGSVVGPDIDDGNVRYRIEKIDRRKRLIWVVPCF